MQPLKTYTDEAIGVVRAAKKIGVPSAVSFTTEVDGTLPGGETLEEAVTRDAQDPQVKDLNNTDPLKKRSRILPVRRSWITIIYRTQGSTS